VKGRRQEREYRENWGEKRSQIVERRALEQGGSTFILEEEKDEEARVTTDREGGGKANSKWSVKDKEGASAEGEGPQVDVGSQTQHVCGNLGGKGRKGPTARGRSGSV